MSKTILSVLSFFPIFPIGLNAQNRFDFGIDLSYFSWHIYSLNSTRNPNNPYYVHVGNQYQHIVPGIIVDYKVNQKLFIKCGFYLEQVKLTFNQNQFPVSPNCSGYINNWFSYWNGEIPIQVGYTFYESGDLKNKLSFLVGPSIVISYVNGSGYEYNIKFIDSLVLSSPSALPLVPSVFLGGRVELDFTHLFKNYSGVEIGVSYLPPLSTFTGTENDLYLNGGTYYSYMKPKADALGLNLRYIFGKQDNKRQ